jgi:hypothetical protein
MMSTVCKIDTELVIPASPAQVWSVFGDFANWGQWNDFMVLPITPSKVGKPCRVLFHLDGGCIKRSVHDPEVICFCQLKQVASLGSIMMQRPRHGPIGGSSRCSSLGLAAVLHLRECVSMT